MRWWESLFEAWRRSAEARLRSGHHCSAQTPAWVHTPARVWQASRRKGWCWTWALELREGRQERRRVDPEKGWVAETRTLEEWPVTCARGQSEDSLHSVAAHITAQSLQAPWKGLSWPGPCSPPPLSRVQPLRLFLLSQDAVLRSTRD